VRPLCVFRLDRPLHAIVPATLRQPPTPPGRSTTTAIIDLLAGEPLTYRLSVLRIIAKEERRSDESDAIFGCFVVCGRIGNQDKSLLGRTGRNLPGRVVC
jgi:hypothetical protein